MATPKSIKIFFKVHESWMLNMREAAASFGYFSYELEQFSLTDLKVITGLSENAIRFMSEETDLKYSELRIFFDKYKRFPYPEEYRCLPSIIENISNDNKEAE